MHQASKQDRFHHCPPMVGFAKVRPNYICPCFTLDLGNNHTLYLYGSDLLNEATQQRNLTR